MWNRPTAAVAMLVTFGTAACASLESGPQHALNGAISSPLEVALKRGEERVVGGSTLYLGFLDVLSDSRCPVDVTCIHPGNAEIRLGVRLGEGPIHAFTVNTSIEPRAAAWNDVRISLTSLAPVPRSDLARDSLLYVASVRVEPATGIR